MNKRIILHGATDLGSSNYGDFLYGYFIYHHILENFKEYDVYFYNPSAYFKKYITLENIDNNSKIRNADKLIYIPGGYFGEGHKAKFKENLMQFYRFMIVGLKAVCLSKDIIIIGIGAGPIKSFLMKNSIKLIGGKAQAISVRDKESLEALETIGVQTNGNYFDMMLAYNFSEVLAKTNLNLKFDSKKKYLLVHYNHSVEARDKFAIAVNQFKKENPDYELIVSADSILQKEVELFENFKKQLDFDVSHFIYDDPFMFTKLLTKVDMVLTTKLHVGVIASMFNKSVVCVAEHPGKSFRYYHKISEAERCLNLYDVEASEIASKLQMFQNIPINISEELYTKTKEHWKVLDNNLLINEK
ncbi:polysaccharide pyruvyl transferase family protein [Streptococcus catagoni]|uniref:polysaccharide pyruvyl transferase family protein n=1 Tax=Streptococcus catagoni TaxID=2654874 RepID=UPI001407345D|nr:polysaccharide pyruvyl transferase family protein [Streptococcus catagoni]